MSVQWIGSKKIAVIPAFNRQVDKNPPSDWVYQIQNRVFYDPDSQTGFDRSLQNYIQAISYGKASIEGEVFPAAWSDDDDTIGAAMRSLPSNHGYTHALVVLPHSYGPHRGGWAAWDISPVNGIDRFARVAMYEDPNFSRRQPLGVWAMEVLHMTTEFGDLYNANPSLDRYDVMACACGSHPSTHTKLAMGWLKRRSVPIQRGRRSSYNLHALALPQPPPPGRVTAVKIPSRTSSGYFLVEARIGVDPYERGSEISSGISKEGIIVYEVAGTLDVFLRTSRALQVGERYENSAEGFELEVKQEISGGYAVDINVSAHPDCPKIRDQIRNLQIAIGTEKDPFRRRQMQAGLQQLTQKSNQLGC